MPFGITELIIVLVIVMLLFGAGRISRIGYELGDGIRGFRKGLNDAESNDTSTS